ncbi:hypothetical protein EI94DRAFT_1814609 [Lactarius quietus]|nr:hypothetical protein EI94DRAFT_1814609 [Lactarius quietus]
MYRDWREIPKAILARGDDAKLPKSKMAQAETNLGRRSYCLLLSPVLLLNLFMTLLNASIKAKRPLSWLLWSYADLGTRADKLSELISVSFEDACSRSSAFSYSTARGINHQTLHDDEREKRPRASPGRSRIPPSRSETTKQLQMEIDVREDPEHALMRAVDAIVRVLELPCPDAKRIGTVLTKSCSYCPAHTDAQINIVDAHAQIVASGDDTIRTFWDALKARSSIARPPHVTIVHGKPLLGCVNLWERCATLYAFLVATLFSARLGHVVANKRIMTAIVEDLHVDDLEADGMQAESAFVSPLDCELRESVDITIELRSANVLPVDSEAGALDASFRRGATDLPTLQLQRENDLNEGPQALC